ncbi:MAG: nicotinamide mononucleotide transporter [Clostridia bacterium]|nr:nicotinamide mononucleotide transporter [Clostridia bacterium]
MSVATAVPNRKALLRKSLLEYLPMAAVAVLILVFAVKEHQAFYKTLPTLVTLAVQILMARANRYGFLLGGFNAALYGVGYLTEGLYFSAASSILFSFPMQIWSFFQWRKNSDGQEVRFRCMKPLVLGGTVGGILLAWLGCVLFLGPLFEGAAFPSLDAYSFVSGIVVTVLMAVRYLEAQYLNLIAGAVALVMWILITLEKPANINFLIISAYNLALTVKACCIWTKQYCRQRRN